MEPTDPAPQNEAPQNEADDGADVGGVVDGGGDEYDGDEDYGDEYDGDEYDCDEYDGDGDNGVDRTAAGAIQTKDLPLEPWADAWAREVAWHRAAGVAPDRAHTIRYALLRDTATIAISGNTGDCGGDWLLLPPLVAIVVAYAVIPPERALARAMALFEAVSHHNGALDGGGDDRKGNRQFTKQFATISVRNDPDPPSSSSERIAHDTIEAWIAGADDPAAGVTGGTVDSAVVAAAAASFVAAWAKAVATPHAARDLTFLSARAPELLEVLSDSDVSPPLVLQHITPRVARGTSGVGSDLTAAAAVDANLFFHVFATVWNDDVAAANGAPPPKPLTLIRRRVNTTISTATAAAVASPSSAATTTTTAAATATLSVTNPVQPATTAATAAVTPPNSATAATDTKTGAPEAAASVAAAVSPLSSGSAASSVAAAWLRVRPFEYRTVGGGLVFANVQFSVSTSVYLIERKLLYE